MVFVFVFCLFIYFLSATLHSKRALLEKTVSLRECSIVANGVVKLLEGEFEQRKELISAWMDFRHEVVAGGQREHYAVLQSINANVKCYAF